MEWLPWSQLPNTRNFVQELLSHTCKEPPFLNILNNYCFDTHTLQRHIHTCVPSGCCTCSCPPDTAPGGANGFKEAPVSSLGRGTLCPARPRGGVMPIESNGCKYPSAAIFTSLKKRLVFAAFGCLEGSWERSNVALLVPANL